MTDFRLTTQAERETWRQWLDGKVPMIDDEPREVMRWLLADLERRDAALQLAQDRELRALRQRDRYRAERDKVQRMFALAVWSQPGHKLTVSHLDIPDDVTVESWEDVKNSTQVFHARGNQ